MLRTKVTSCLKPRLLCGSVRCYKFQRAHGALTRELSEGGTESMTERDDHRTGSGGVKDNVRDELAEAAGYRKEAAPEEEEQAGSGGVKDTARDELAESQENR